MKILFADKVDESRLPRLADAGHEFVVEPSLSSDELAARVPGFDILVVRSTKVPAEAIAAGDHLALIVRAGAGTDNIDVAAASAHGVYVCNVPGRNATAVAELAMGLLLAVDRRIASCTADLRSGVWNKSEYSRADGIFGKTLAIVGLGSIGLLTAERARGFGMEVTALRRPGRDAVTEQRIRSLGIRLVDDLDTLLGNADVVSIHVPKNEHTVGMIDAEFLAKLRANAILINTARGETMIESDMVEALDNGLRAGLDVFPNEPSSSTADFASILASHSNVVGTHHIGASTAQAQEATVDGTLEVIEAFAAGSPINCINMEQTAVGPVTMSLRHEDKVGVLAQVFARLREAGINVQQMENRIFAGSAAAVAVINLASEPTDDTVAQLQAIDEIFGVQIVPIGAN